MTSTTDALLSLALELTPEVVIVRYTVSNRSALPLFVKNGTRLLARSSEPAWRYGNCADVRVTRPPLPGATPNLPGPVPEEWAAARYLDLHPVGDTMLLLHSSKHYPVLTPFMNPPGQLMATMIRPNDQRTYEVRMVTPLEQFETLGGDEREPAVLVRQAFLRMEYAHVPYAPEKDGHPGFYEVRPSGCLTAVVELPVPVWVHPMRPSAAHAKWGYADALAQGANSRAFVPPGGLERAAIVNQDWDRRWGPSCL